MRTQAANAVLNDLHHSLERSELGVHSLVGLLIHVGISWCAAIERWMGLTKSGLAASPRRNGLTKVAWRI